MAAPPKEIEITSILRSGDVPSLDRVVREKILPVEHRDENGDSLLMRAALYGSKAQVKYLLEQGANVNATNRFGVTPLIRAGANKGIVKMLLDRGANPNIRTALGNTPLILGARSADGFETVALLLDRGADFCSTNIFGANALLTAAASGNLKTVELLLEKGANPNVHPAPSQDGTLWGGGRTPLMWAAFRGDLPLAQLIVKHGGRINEPDGFGSPLAQAAWGDRYEMAQWLIAQGANVHARDRFSDFTPLHWAALSEKPNTDLVKLLLESGADVNAKGGEPIDAFMGIEQTPLMQAQKRGDTPITRLFLAKGATLNELGEKAVPVPRRSSALTVDESTLLSCINRAVPLLQETALRSRKSFIAHSSKQDCVSCHQQYLPMAALAFARRAGGSVNLVSEKELIEMVRKNESNMAELNAQATFHPEPAHSYGYALFGLRSSEQPSSPGIDAEIHHLTMIQGNQGQWYNNLPRPPLQTSDITATALAIHSLRNYGFPARKQEFSHRIDKARKWLWKAKAANTEERAFQLLGLSWAGESPRKLKSLAAALLAEQHLDGGWAQLPGLNSDAYATGQSLFALQVAIGLEPQNSRADRALKYLINSQLEDGSWFVARRAFPFQPTMKSGFPHSRDSWISCAGSSWATIAVANALVKWDSDARRLKVAELSAK